MVARWEGCQGTSKKGGRTEKYKQVVIEQSWGCEVQHRKWSSHRTYIGRTHGHGPPHSGDGLRGSRGLGGEGKGGKIGTTVIAQSIKYNLKAPK